MTPCWLPPPAPEPGGPFLPALPLAPLCPPPGEQIAARLAAGGLLPFALQAAAREPGPWDPQENKLCLLLSYPPWQKCFKCNK